MLSQSRTLHISLFTKVTRSLGFFPVTNKFESSANSSENKTFDTFDRSLIYNKNKIGPRIKPCGTPHVINFEEEDISF